VGADSIREGSCPLVTLQSLVLQAAWQAGARVMVVFQHVFPLDKTSSTLCGGSLLSPAWSVSCIATLYKFWALIVSGFGQKDHCLMMCIRT